ncbi:unnamed protein product [Allacma fusca]|uniref:Uncharacterized protein n=1 Tax=Allacma fusca TaxID=39272 RepID=A0A8J2PAU0_9HEXA|nr:unnamed protein product [Allacma fusca]
MWSHGRTYPHGFTCLCMSSYSSCGSTYYWPDERELKIKACTSLGEFSVLWRGEECGIVYQRTDIIGTMVLLQRVVKGWYYFLKEGVRSGREGRHMAGVHGVCRVLAYFLDAVHC